MTSSEDLKGFPMVFSYSQTMLNNKLAAEHQAHNENMFPSSLSTSGDNGMWTFNVTQFGAPTVSFDTPTVLNGCKLVIPIVQGTFSTWVFQPPKNGQGPPIPSQKNISLNGRHLTVITPVKQRRHTDFSDVQFGIEAIYADLSQVQSANIGFDDVQEINTTYGKVGIDHIITQGLHDWVVKYRAENNGRNPMIFGGARLPNIPDPKYRLHPTGCTYSTTISRDNNNHYVTGTLNLLLEIDGVTVPTAQGTGIYDAPLVRSDGDEGALVISSYAFSKVIVMPSLVNSYSSSSSGYKFSVRHSNSTSTGAVYLENHVSKHFGREKLSSWLARLGKDLPDQREIHSMFGILEAHIEVDPDLDLTVESIEGCFTDHTYRVTEHCTSVANHWSGDITTKVVSYVDWKFSIDDDGKLHVEKGDRVTTKTHDSNMVTRVLGDIITFGFDEMGIDDREDESLAEIAAVSRSLSASVDHCLQAIVLPGGQSGIFEYRGTDFRTTANGQPNLFVYAKYTSEA